ncbi:vls recombination cassette Vls9a (plasmid) [Borreliella valaisiana VS116]|uniref:Variable large protein n=1 Tax=Borreliella valaisiana VS116 TaxID=445987 RepID=C0R9I4_BORVA|nr:variable large family protein [Borreliella valaisiana]ACN53106.1 vls recombination cassette Vls9a [Borreliella valaisiana VS116]
MLKDVEAARDGAANKDAGKLFKTTGGGGLADAAAVAKAAAAVSAVSGKQIIKAIVDAAGEDQQAGEKAAEAANPIAAAIGTNRDAGAGFNNGRMQNNGKIAAAIVLRGLAKDGKFAASNDNGAKKESVNSVVESAVGEMSTWLEDMIKAAAGDAANGAAGKEANKESVKEIAKGIKGIVDAAGKSGGNALKDVVAAGDNDANKDAGKLFKTHAALDDVAAVAKAAAAVSAVSGKQIIKAIVDAAGAGADQQGAEAAQATNPIAAAIGTDRDNAAAGFNAMQNNGKIAAAIVLRGLAKDGKFAANNNNGGKAVNVNSVVGEMSAWLEDMIKAAGDAIKGAAAGPIGNAANEQGKEANEESVNGIAKEIKGIVDAAGKAGGKDGNGLKDVEAVNDGNANADAGKLFKTRAGGGLAAGDVAKAAAAVSAVSGKADNKSDC